MFLVTDQIANTLRAVLRKGGYELTKSNRMQALLARQDALLRAAAEALPLASGKGKAPVAEGVVFSKDRPLQLHLLLQSYADMVSNPVPLHVQYAASTPAFAKAYDEVLACFPKLDLRVVKETRFKATLLPLLDSLRAEKMFFLMDDDVFIQKVDMTKHASVDPKHVTMNVVLSPQVSHCYTTQKTVAPPLFTQVKGRKELREFRWSELNGGLHSMWTYPMMVDGTLFDTREMRLMAATTDYKAPNSFEGALMEFAHGFRQRRGYCYEKAVLMNLPLNKVQTENANHAGSSGVEEMLATWQQGLCIDPTPYYGMDFTGFKTKEPLDELAVNLVPRKGMKKAA